MTSNKFGIEHSKFRFHFVEEVINKETMLTLSGFPNDVIIKGWKVQPLRIPPVVSNVI